eukprot:g3226.t1
MICNKNKLKPAGAGARGPRPPRAPVSARGPAFGDPVRQIFRGDWSSRKRDTLNTVLAGAKKNFLQLSFRAWAHITLLNKKVADVRKYREQVRVMKLDACLTRFGETVRSRIHQQKFAAWHELRSHRDLFRFGRVAAARLHQQRQVHERELAQLHAPAAKKVLSVVTPASAAIRIDEDIENNPNYRHLCAEVRRLVVRAETAEAELGAEKERTARREESAALEKREMQEKLEAKTLREDCARAARAEAAALRAAEAAKNAAAGLEEEHARTREGLLARFDAEARDVQEAHEAQQKSSRNEVLDLRRELQELEQANREWRSRCEDLEDMRREGARTLETERAAHEGALRELGRKIECFSEKTAEQRAVWDRERNEYDEMRNDLTRKAHLLQQANQQLKGVLEQRQREAGLALEAKSADCSNLAAQAERLAADLGAARKAQEAREAELAAVSNELVGCQNEAAKLRAELVAVRDDLVSEKSGRGEDRRELAELGKLLADEETGAQTPERAEAAESSAGTTAPPTPADGLTVGFRKLIKDLRARADEQEWSAGDELDAYAQLVEQLQEKLRAVSRERDMLLKTALK